VRLTVPYLVDDDEVWALGGERRGERALARTRKASEDDDETHTAVFPLEDERIRMSDWLLSMGLMWATDLKTGLKGSVGAVLLLSAHVVNWMPRV
jgi:hypothetical protein